MQRREVLSSDTLSLRFKSRSSHRIPVKIMLNRVLHTKTNKHWISPLRYECVCAQPRPTLCNPMDCSHQAPLSMEFSRQEYWNGLPFPSQGIFLTQESNPHLLCLLHQQVDGFFTTKPAGAYNKCKQSDYKAERGEYFEEGHIFGKIREGSQAVRDE